MALITVIVLLLSLTALGNPTVLSQIYSVSTTSLYATYILPMALLLWRRISGGITIRSASASGAVLFNRPGGQLVWGPWRIPGWLGIVNNAFACAFMSLVFIVSVLPQEIPVEIDNMRWCSVLFVFFLLISGIMYVTIGRKSYAGPVNEVGFE